MRLTSLTLTNFKAVGAAPVTIKFKPITLLFGPNSSGKSTIVQALHYLREILHNDNCDPGRTSSGGSLDLGGFRSLVHKHDVNGQICLRVDWELEEGEQAKELVGIGDAHYQLRSAWVELKVGWSEFRNEVCVVAYATGINGELFAECVESWPLITERRDGSIPDLSLNCKHPFLQSGSDGNSLESIFGKQQDASSRISLMFYSRRGALPFFDRRLRIISMRPLESDDTGTAIPGRITDLLSHCVLGPGLTTRNEMTDLLYVGPLRDIPYRDHLPERSQREVLRPSGISERAPNLERWASGLAAWDVLHTAGPDFVKLVNDWLYGQDRMNSGYSIHVSQTKEIDVDSALAKALAEGKQLADASWVRQAYESLPVRKRVYLRDEAQGLDLAAPDVGVGLSQVVPVIVAALYPENLIIAIEQPELHIHPAFQVILGDLFISRIRDWHASEAGVGGIDFDAAEARLLKVIGSAENLSVGKLGEQGVPAEQSEAPVRNKFFFLIETHSEHLILRLLRRIRETHQDELPSGALALTPDEIGVYYLEPGEDGVRVRHLRIDDTGEFIDRWPKGFFEERAEELF